MKKLFVLFLFTILQLSVYAVGSIQWQKCLGGTSGEWSYAIQETTDGGYIISGKTTSNDGDVSGNHGYQDIWVVKLDSIGNIQWQKCLGGTSDDVAYSVQQTIDGGYILTGYTGSIDSDVNGNHGSNDFWVVKLDSIGNLQWQKCLGGTSNDVAYSVQQTTDGGFILAGYTNSNDGDVIGNHGFNDVWVVKLDGTGNLQWQKCLGGTQGESANYIQQTTDGGYILTGSANSIDGDVSGCHNSPYPDIWVVKIDGFGNLQWQKCLGGTFFEYSRTVHQCVDSGYIIAGWTNSNDGDVSGFHGGYNAGDAWIVKLDNAGNPQWQRCMGGSSDDFANSIQQTSDGGYIFTGETSSYNGNIVGNFPGSGSSYWVVKLSSTVGMNGLSSITSLNVYPNPTSDNLTVNLSLSKTENLTLQLKNVLGQTVIEPLYLKNCSGTFTHTISTSKLPNGIYLLDIMGEEGRRTEKIVVEH